MSALREATNFPVMSPALGLVSGTPAFLIPDRAWAKVENVRFRKGSAEKVPGYIRTQTAALDGELVGLYDYVTSTGYQAWIAVTTRKVYKRSPADPEFVDITGATPLTGNLGEWADFATVRDGISGKDLLIITNGRDPIKKWDGVAASISDLGGNPPKALRLAVFQNHLMLAHIDPYGGTPEPQTLEWSDLGLPEVWTGGEAGSSIFNDEPTALLEIIPLRDHLIAYKEDAVYAVEYTVFPFTMSRVRIATGIGPISARCVVPVRDVHIFPSTDGQFYRLDASGPHPVGEHARIDFFTELNFAYRHNAFGVLNDTDGEIYFVIPVAADTLPSVAYIYSHLENAWGRRLLSATCAAPRGVRQLSDVTWDEVTTPWDSMTLTWDQMRLTTGGPVMLHGDAGGFVYKHASGENNADDAAIVSDIYTKVFDFGDPVRQKRLLRLYLMYNVQPATTLQVYVYTRDMPTSAPREYGPYSFVLTDTPEPWIDLQITGRFFQFRFTNAELDQPFALSGYVPAVYTREVS